MLDTRYGESVVFGKFDIYNRGDLKNKDISFQLKNRETGKSYKIKLDDDGFFIKKIKPGNYEIKQVYYKDKYINLPHGYLTTTVDKADSLFYVGNIYINWSPIHYERKNSPYFYAAFGLIGGTIISIVNESEQKDVDLIPSIVRDKKETIERLNHFYPQNTKEIIHAPINIKVYN